jgi:hypothetical protein
MGGRKARSTGSAPKTLNPPAATGRSRRLSPASANQRHFDDAMRLMQEKTDKHIELYTQHVALLRKRADIVKIVNRATERADHADSDAICKFVAAVDKTRVKRLSAVVKSPGKARGRNGTQAKGATRTAPRQHSKKEDPCESPNTQRKLIKCMKSCCQRRDPKTLKP